MRVYFNDDNTKRGVEGWYEIADGKMTVYVEATNCREDWLSNFTAFPLWDGFARGFVHAGYKAYARWLAGYIATVLTNYDMCWEDVTIIGYSMGGGIAQIVGEYFPELVTIVSIDGPRSTSGVRNPKGKLYCNRGSLVNCLPWWFCRLRIKIVLNKVFSPFWKSHGDYDIEELIRRNHE